MTVSEPLRNFHAHMSNLESYFLIGVIPSTLRTVVSTAEIIAGLSMPILCCPCYCMDEPRIPSALPYLTDGIKNLSESLMNICSLTLYQTFKQACYDSNSHTYHSIA